MTADLRPRPRRGAPSWFRPTEAPFAWLGVAVTVAGAAVLVLGWASVAREDALYRQLPYVVSAGLVGLGIVLAGLTLVFVAATVRDDAVQARQLEELAALLRERGAGETVPEEDG